MLRPLAISLAMLTVSACAGTPLPHEAGGRPGLDYEALVTAPHHPLTETRQRVVETATALVGTPYKFGGTTPSGFDCSGYVRYVFERAAGVELPRQSIDQIQYGRPSPPTRVQPGDLVYFRISGKKDLHIGIYLGDGRFVHAPSSGGAVNIQSLEMTYWRERFLGARQVLAL